MQCEKANANCSSITAPMPVFGSTPAKVGFILDYAAVSQEEDSFLEHPMDEGPASQRPWSLKVCKFTESNILLWTYNFGKLLPRTQLSSGIRFAVGLLSLQKEATRAYAVETVGLVGTILGYARDERLGREKITTKTVGGPVLLWLNQKDLAIEGLKRIETLAGSLSRGLLMILHYLPRNETRASSKRQTDPGARAMPNAKRVRCHEPFDKDVFREVKKIVLDDVTEKEESYKTALQGVSPDKPLEGDQNPEMEIVSDETSGPSALSPTSSEVEDGHILELEPLCKRAVDLGLLDLKLSKARRDRPNYKGHQWRQEVGKFDNKEYSYQMGPENTRSRSINVNYCRIGFQKNEDVGDGTVSVKIEVNPPGQQHGKCYATGALDSDPASRPAFRVRYKSSRREQQERYAHAQGRKSLYAANTLVDILVDNKPNEMITKTPRRYLYFNSESKFPEELKRFVGGAYTEDT
ncbi:hypothetical protein PEX1_083610 [Penicillium expansum]|uniref:Uncharacterized protein n=1 Tax=Penicillium expansum TaxID=27334 RepID=A0A0A2KN89_PENEN|nr:hypothetical protein PEX2_094330 [Penicillium expansum]KGO50967.1 hypothetical protein PEX2_094330 [Penicillium expansum]KGO65815.1 hypothetical protein PEX1_083610 [Penicillium expansum]